MWFKKKKKDLLIRALKYSYNTQKFTMKDITEALNLNKEEKDYIFEYVRSGGDHSVKQLFQTREKFSEEEEKDNTGYYPYYLRLTPQAIFHYLEYVELVNAKKNARWSTFLSIIAISLAAITVAFTLYEKYKITN